MKITSFLTTNKSHSETQKPVAKIPRVFFVSYTDGMLALWADRYPVVEWRDPDGWSRHYGRSEIYAQLLAQFIGGNSGQNDIRWIDDEFAMRWVKEIALRRRARKIAIRVLNRQLPLFGGE